MESKNEHHCLLFEEEKNGVRKMRFSLIERTNSIQLSVQFVYCNERRANKGEQYSFTYISNES